MLQRLFAAGAIAALLAAPLAAEPAKTDPKTTPKVEAPKDKKAPVGAKVNLNTATAEELVDKLPQIGPARAKDIIDARKKAPFKNWDDFVKRNVVPSNAEKAIQNLVSF